MSRIAEIADMIERAERRLKRARQRLAAAQEEEDLAFQALFHWREEIRKEVRP